MFLQSQIPSNSLEFPLTSNWNSGFEKLSFNLELMFSFPNIYLSFQFYFVEILTKHNIQTNVITIKERKNLLISVNLSNFRTDSRTFSLDRFCWAKMSLVQFYLVQFSTLLFILVQYDLVQFGSVRFYSVQFSTLLFSSVQYASI